MTGLTDSSGKDLPNKGTSIVVMVSNLCPADGNPLCSQATTTDTNSYGANVNVDLCSDSGAASAFFGDDLNEGIGMVIGTVEEVNCNTGGPFTVLH